MKEIVQNTKKHSVAIPKDYGLGIYNQIFRTNEEAC